jgi:hypothetical protein
MTAFCRCFTCGLIFFVIFNTGAVNFSISIFVCFSILDINPSMYGGPP